MKKIKVISKGYTLTVVSWENDGDNYKTQQVTVEDKNVAAALVKMCRELLLSINNSTTGVGNATEYETETAEKLVVEFMKSNPVLCNGKSEAKKLIPIARDWIYNLVDSSEYYYARVCESVSVTYSSEDVYLEEVNF